MSGELDEAKKQIAILRTALVQCRKDHDGLDYVGEFIACTPAKRAEEGHCICGADVVNAIIDAALAGKGCPGFPIRDGNYTGCTGGEDCPICRGES